MEIQRTDNGFVTTLRSTGLGRFFGAAFLGVWLVGWLAGETFALWMLGAGGWSFFTGQPPSAGRNPVNLGVAIAGGLFLLFWLSFWTLGGVAAIWEFLRLLFGKDRFEVTSDAVKIDNGYGLFHSTKDLRRDEVVRFYNRPNRAALCADTFRGSIELSRVGTWKDRVALAQELNTHFSISPEHREGQLPSGWCEISSPERESILVKDPATRRKQALFAWTICFILSFIAAYLVNAAGERPGLWALAIFMVIVTALVAWGALWLNIGRNEWLLDRGRITLQRRFSQVRTKKFEAAALELIEENSGDNGPDYELIAVAPGAEPRPSHSYRLGKQRRIIYSEPNDPTAPRNLGLWLSQHCSIPLTDETSTEARAKQLAEIREKLAGSGRIGRFTLRLIDKIATGPATTDVPQ
ncbi:MAG TPA: hypothetical protein VH170_05935 [Chthoniobacterales bacterium]|jgi:hypothetical protein|nr:hypothetical protein [Chthoniobacterales bacterium]